MEALEAATMAPEFSITSEPAPPSSPTVAAEAVVPASPNTAPARPMETLPASAVAALANVMFPVLVMVSFPSPPAIPVATAMDRLSAPESP